MKKIIGLLTVLAMITSLFTPAMAYQPKAEAIFFNDFASLENGYATSVETFYVNNVEADVFVEYRAKSVGESANGTVIIGTDNETVELNAAYSSEFATYTAVVSYDNKTAVLYKDGVAVSEPVDMSDVYDDVDGEYSFVFSAGNVAYDYVASYEIPESFEILEGATTKDAAIICTNMPVSLNSTVTLNGKATTITKLDAPFEYSVALPENLKVDGLNTVVVNALGLNGEAAGSANYEFTSVAYTMPEYVASEVYLNNNFDDEKELENYTIGLSNGVNTVAVSGGKALLSAVEGTTGNNWPNMNYSTGFTTEKDFVIDYKVDGFGNWCYFTVAVSSTAGAYKLEIAPKDKTGAFKILYKASEGNAYCYDSTGTLVKTTSLATADKVIGGIRFATQTYKTSTTTIDYIRVYELADEFSMNVETADAKSLILKTTQPVNVAKSSFAINGVAANVEAVATEANTYKITYGEALSYNTDYVLTSTITNFEGENVMTEYGYAFKTIASAPYIENTQRFFEDFENITELDSTVYTTTGKPALFVTNGKMRLTRNDAAVHTEQYSSVTINGIKVGSNPVVVEYKQKTTGGYSSSTLRLNGIDSARRGTNWEDYVYAIYYPATGSFTEYDANFAELANKTGAPANAEGLSVRFGTQVANADGTRYHEWDYVAAYDYNDAFAAKAYEAGVDGIVFKTTGPVDVTDATATIGDIQATIEKVANSYNTYKLIPAGKLNYSTKYTASITADYLGSASKQTAVFEFETEAYIAPEYAAPAERFFEDFEEMTTETIDKSIYSSSGTVSIVDGKFRTTQTSSERYPGTNVNGINIAMKPTVIEIKAISVGMYTGSQFIIGQGKSGTRKNDWESTIYVLYDPVKGTFTEYNGDLSVFASVTGATSNTTPMSFRIGGEVISTERYREMDYVAVYDYQEGFAAKVESADAKSAIIKTTGPIDITDAVVKIGDSEAVISKVDNSYNTYKVVFGEKLLYNTDYTMSITADYLGYSDKLTCNAEFNTGDFVAPEYSAPKEFYFDEFSETTELDTNVFSAIGGGKTYFENDRLNLTYGDEANRWPSIDFTFKPGNDTVIIEAKSILNGTYNATTAFFTNNVKVDAGNIKTHLAENGLTDGFWEGTFYYIYNPVKGSFVQYHEDFTEFASGSGLDTSDSTPFLRFGGNITTNNYQALDYIAVYKYEDLAIKLEDVTTKDATLKTTVPINTKTTVFTVGDTTATAVKVNDSYNTYKLIFADELTELSSYTLSVNAEYLGGSEKVSLSETFETPKYDYAFTALTTEETANGVVAVITATNNTDADKTFNLVIAAYKGDKLYDVKSTSVTSVANTEGVKLTSEAVSAGDGVTYKAFAWESTMEPVKLR